MKFRKKTTGILFALFIASATVHTTKAQEEDGSWQEIMRDLTFSPRYFGPNAFPIPELRSGRIDTSWEIEVRGEYHTYEGDRVKDIYARLFVPIAEGRVGLEVSYIFYEYYNMTPETAAERRTAGTSWHEGAHGDVLVSTFFRLLQSDKWADVMVEATLKTASGNRLADARYTDAASYWFNLNIGRDIYKSAGNTASVRLQGLIGFYCWMTNDIVHRQNDAFLYSGGISGNYKNLSAHVDIAGFHGYKDNGDSPLRLRTKINYEYRKNILSLRYKHGMQDDLYDSFSVAYIRCF